MTEIIEKYEKSEENDTYQELQEKHADLWNGLSVLPVEQATELLDSFSSQIQLQHVKERSYRNLKSTLRSPWFYVTLIIGLCLPIIFYVGFIYTSLAIE